MMERERERERERIEKKEEKRGVWGEGGGLIDGRRDIHVGSWGGGSGSGLG